MTKQTINIGSTANDGTGTAIRDSFDIVNDNFTELYTRQGAVAGTLFEAVVSAVKYFEVSEKYPGELFYISQIIAGTFGSGVYTYSIEISMTTSLSSQGSPILEYTPTPGTQKSVLEICVLSEVGTYSRSGRILIDWSKLVLLQSIRILPERE